MKETNNITEYRENPVFMDLVSLLGNGFVLSLFNIDFLFLKYLFPIVGCAIMLYGCHLMKEYSSHFMAVYYIALARFMLMMVNFLLDWTSISSNLYVTYIQITCSLIIITLLFIYLDKGFSSMYADAGFTSYRHPLFKYIFLYFCNVVSTYLTIQLGVLGALVSIIILLINVLYIALTFHRIGNELTKSSLEIELSTYTKSLLNKHFFYIAFYIVILGVTIYFSNKGSLFTPQSPDGSVNVSLKYEKIQSKLISLGMDKDLVKDLPTNENEYLSSASSILVQTDTKNANGGAIKFTTYRIKLDDAERILIYYNWIKEPDNRLFQILEYNQSSLHNICELNSCSLYSHPDNNQTIRISSVEDNINNAGNPYTNQKLSNVGDSLRGYLAFSYSPVDSSSLPLLDMQVELYYQVSIFNLPYLKIVDYMNDYEKYRTSIVYNRLTIPIIDLFKK